MSTLAAMLCLLLVGAGAPDPAADAVLSLVDSAAAADDDVRKAILAEAELRARRDLEADPGSVDRRYALAVVLGARANTEGGRSKVRAASELYDHLVVVLHAEPGHVGARHLLGRLHAGVRRMGGVTRWVATKLMGGAVLESATWATAEENLTYAERYGPGVPDHHLQLALLYRDTGRPGLAAAELEHVLALEASSALDHAARAEALEVRASLRP